MRYERLSIVRIDETVRLWNEAIGEDFPMRRELLLQNTFVAKNLINGGTLLAIDDAERVAGFVSAKMYMEPDDFGFNKQLGWIQVLLVRQNCRNHGVGSKLLSRAEQSLMASGAQRIILGKDPRHYFPGIPSSCEEAEAWFCKKGYQYEGTEYDLLTEETIRQLPVVDECIFGLLGRDEKDALIRFLHRCFPGRWEYEIMNYFKSGGDGREIVVLKKKDRIIGFCRINDSKSPEIAQNVYWAPLFADELGGIGPLGIDPTERNKGYGLSIVQAAISILSLRGIKHFVIDWTKLIMFYQKVGARPWKIYHCYSKKAE